METLDNSSSQEPTRQQKKDIIEQLITSLQTGKKPLVLKPTHLARAKYFPILDATQRQIIKDLIDPTDLHAEHLATQIKQAQEAIDNGEVMVSTHHFDHTIRDGHKFDTDKPSVRYQLAFSHLDIKTPFLLPVSDKPSDEAVAIRRSPYDRKRIPYALTINFLRSKFLPVALKDTLSRPTLQPHKFEHLHVFLMQEQKYMDAFKEYLAAGKPLSYLTETTPTNKHPDGMKEHTTARVIELPDKTILLSQHADQVYTESHLRRYTGTDFFFKVFPSRKEYMNYEQKTLQKLNNNQRFENLAQRITINFCSKVADHYELDDGLLNQELTTARRRFDGDLQDRISLFGQSSTPTDQKLTTLFEKILNSTHLGHIKDRMREAIKQIDLRKEQTENMKATIRTQYPQG